MATAAFAVTNRNYLSARWPGDVYLLRAGSAISCRPKRSPAVGKAMAAPEGITPSGGALLGLVPAEGVRLRLPRHAPGRIPESGGRSSAGTRRTAETRPPPAPT